MSEILFCCPGGHNAPFSQRQSSIAYGSQTIITCLECQREFIITIANVLHFEDGVAVGQSLFSSIVDSKGEFSLDHLNFIQEQS